MSDTVTKSQAVADDVTALLRARNPLLWIVSREEGRVERYLIEAAAAAGYKAFAWDVAQGVTDPITDKVAFNGLQDPSDVLDNIRNCARNEASPRVLWILRDLPVWLGGGAVGAGPTRRLRNLAKFLPGVPPNNSQAIVVLTPSADVPQELQDHATLIEWPLPDREEIGDILDTALEGSDKYEKLTNGNRDAAIEAAVGLSEEEAQACFASSLVRYRRIDPVVVGKEKRRVIAREQVLEWFDPLPGGLDAVGGLENLKDWLLARTTAYSPKARAYGLPMPKGALLVGVSGCGKSLLAKAVGTAWSVPLLRLDLGSLKSKFVGDSEAKLRKALRVIEAIGRCILWIEEIEKALQGATSGSSDGGVSADALGTILTWMQERQGGAFVVATANSVENLPPEFLRKGRFDEVWFVDLPNLEERKSIIAATVRSYGRDPKKLNINLDQVAVMCENFSGAEVAALVPEAMFVAFNTPTCREITTKDLIAAADKVVPLADTAKEKIVKLREWAQGRARRATAEEKERTPVKRVRKLDMA